jgi:hypothetical protein
MNPNNYAILEASKRLVEAGIVLETDAGWVIDGYDWMLMPKDKMASWAHFIPAPSLAEVWRELPNGCYIQQVEDGFVVGMDNGTVSVHTRHTTEANPTDALISLLIWVKGKDKK